MESTLLFQSNKCQLSEIDFLFSSPGLPCSQSDCVDSSATLLLANVACVSGRSHSSPCQASSTPGTLNRTVGLRSSLLCVREQGCVCVCASVCAHVWVHVWVQEYVCVCVCTRVRDNCRDTERQSERDRKTIHRLFSNIFILLILAVSNKT